MHAHRIQIIDQMLLDRALKLYINVDSICNLLMHEKLRTMPDRTCMHICVSETNPCLLLTVIFNN